MGAPWVTQPNPEWDICAGGHRGVLLQAEPSPAPGMETPGNRTGTGSIPVIQSFLLPPLFVHKLPQSISTTEYLVLLSDLEKDLSARIDSPCGETNASQTAAGLSYPLKYSCGGVMWNMFPFKMLVSFDVCANECAILSLRLPKSVTCWRLCMVCFSNDTS